MGLDMYLKARKNLSSPDAGAVAEQAGLLGLTDPNYTYTTVEVSALYWRKANAIHRWFVEHVQGGKDDCGEYDVSIEQLVELHDTCAKALEVAVIGERDDIFMGATLGKSGELKPIFERGLGVLNVEEVAAILPAQAGFFFGATDYGPGYVQDLRDTVAGLNRILADPSVNDRKGFGHVWFCYQSSW